MWGKWKQNYAYWTETTSFHGPAEIQSGRTWWCNIFWIIVMVVMVVLAVILNYKVIETFVLKLPSTTVNFAKFQNETEMLEFYRLIYCPSAFLDIQKLVNDGIKYAAVIYALLLLEGDNIDNNVNFPLPFTKSIADTKLKDLMANDLLIRIQFGGGLASFLTIPIETNDDEDSQNCPYCDDNKETTCFRNPLLAKIKTALTKNDFIGDDGGIPFSEYLQSKNFSTVRQFFLHYAVNFQKSNRNPIYTSRFKRICQEVIPQRTAQLVKDKTGRAKESKRRKSEASSKFTYSMIYSSQNMSPCLIDRRAISLYTGTKIIEDLDNSYPFFEGIRDTDQSIAKPSEPNQTKVSQFIASTTRYSNIRRPDNNCYQNNKNTEKYPYFANAHLSCIDSCNIQYDIELCTPQLRGLNLERKQSFCAIDMETGSAPEWTNHITENEEKWSRKSMDSCIKDCERLLYGYCTTYDIVTELESQAQETSDAPRPEDEWFEDKIVLKASKTIVSFVETPQVSIEALFSQIGGNLGLFLGASWVSFIHLIATCCCYSCIAVKHDQRNDNLNQVINYGGEQREHDVKSEALASISIV